MRITIEGTVFCVVGFFSYFQNTRAVEDALRELGGVITKSVARKTQVLIWEAGYTLKVDDAKARGLPILNEAQVQQLLADGVLDVEFETPSLEGQGASLDALLGEARGILATPPSPLVWTQIVDLLTQCSPDYVEALVEYIGAHIDRWHERDHMLCILPKAWIVSMGEGVNSPMYRIVRWVDLTEARLSITAAKNLFGCADLTSTRRIDFPREKKLSKAVFSVISKSPKFKTVRVLIFGKMFTGAATGLTAGDALHGVHTVGSRHSWRCSESDFTLLREVFACAAFTHTRRFSCAGPYSFTEGEDVLGIEGELEGIDHLVFDVLSDKHSHARFTAFKQYRIDCLLDSPTVVQHMARIETFTVMSPTGSKDPTHPWDLTSMAQLKTLRFYTSQECLNADDAPERIANVFHPHQMTFAPTLETLVTNIPLEHSSLEAFASAYPSVEIVYEPWLPPF